MNKEMSVEKRNLWVIAAGYVVFLLLFLSQFNFNPSATINFSEHHLDQYSGVLPHNLVVLSNDGYDGQYYYFMALNPSFSHIHSIGFNFLQRILYPISASLLSFGHPPLLPSAFLLLNLVAALLSSFLLMKILKKYGAGPNLAFMWAFSVGVLISLSSNLTELWMMCFVFAALYFFEEKKIWASASFLSLALLTRESSITLVAGFILYCLLRRRFKHAGIFILSTVPFYIWQKYFLFAHGVTPFSGTRQALSIPNILTNSNSAGPGIMTMALEKINALKSIFVAPESLTFERLQSIYQLISPWPILFFIVIISCMALYNLCKERKISLYLVLLFSQIAFMFVITPKIMISEGIEATGRYAIALYAISFIYFAERGKKYSRILAILLIGSALAYFFQRALIPKGPYYLSLMHSILDQLG